MRIMKLASLALALGIGAVPFARAADEVEPGLVGEYFFGKSGFAKIEASDKPNFVRVDKVVNFPDVAGDFYGIRADDNFFARWTGKIEITKPGKWTFFCESDDGSRITINGKVVVENGGSHPMEEKSGTVELTSGVHDVLIEYYDGSGEAGCIISWQAPGGKREVVPEAAFKHKKGAEAIAFDKAAWEKRPKGSMDVKNTASANKGGGGGKPGKFDLMEFGAYQTGTVKANYPSNNNWAYKGVSIRLTPDKQAGICYDTEGLRVSCAWTEGFLTLPKGRDGLEGQQTASGKPHFGAKAGPGWAKGDDWADPREKTFGPLPHDWARYKGLYVNGEKIVLKYEVQGTTVLEMPALEKKDGVDFFARNLNLTKVPTALTMLVHEKDKAKGGVTQFGQTGGGLTGSVKDSYAWLEDGTNIIAAAAIGAPEGATWQVTETGRVHLKIPAGDGGKIQVLLANIAPTDISKFAAQAKSAATVDLEPLTKGGPTRWNEPVITKGEIGTEPGAYQLDILTVPYDNPWKSYMRMTGMDFFKDGRIAVANIDGDVWIVSGIDAKLEALNWKRYATGMFQALGLKIVDDVVYVLGRDQITRLHDLNKDGEADFYECFNNDCKVQAQYHEFAHDLHTDKDGNFIYMKGSDLGAQGTIHNGTMLKVSKDGSKTEVIAVGFRAPNGMGLGPNGELSTGDNQGTWTPLCPINWVKPGGFYGHVQNLHENAKDKSPRNPPICWLPMSTDNSSGGQVWATSDKFGPLSGKMLHMSYGKCRLFSVMYEDTLDGEKQGGVAHFPFNFPSGVMRGRTSHIDGQVYLSGMRGWQTSAGKDGCLTRVRYTGKPAYWPMNIHATKKGVEITFSDALDKASAGDLENWGVEWFTVDRTSGYGSPEFSVVQPEEKAEEPKKDESAKDDGKKKADPKKKKKTGRDPVKIDKITVSEDGKKVFLSMPEIKEVTNMVIKYKIKGADGTELKSEIDNTIHKLLAD